ncbi:DUF3106 domain-containing protein [Curvibacter sp. APW13]|uniref:DUF3106 domain-containing protein n=1 Tax=Curvibacter sp. APW13 TaxID=3077236 RepID=UPI0028E03466|nr:DUF3106 domain-containing protein [Curvibacter sp. APW13]MDT8992242.1 DUF3106 domain-containing protein [Curvibacter sp. APW13]
MPILLGLTLCVSLEVAAQSPDSSVAGGATARTALPAIGAPRWDELTPPQQSALAPLQPRWNELGEGHRRKWIAIVKNFASLSSVDQQKVQERMASWASLDAAQRERARENFANSKLAPPANKAGTWEEYLALPTEEREKLAAQAGKKRPSAAKNPKPNPVTSPALLHAPQAAVGTPWSQAQQLRGNLRDWLDPNTLLPIAPTP